jgi:MoxR-like ATPase
MGKVFQLTKQSEYRKAGPDDLIRLEPLKDAHPLCLPKNIIEDFVRGIVDHEFIHLSGPTGTAKTAMTEAMCAVPINFETICREMGFDVKPIRLHSIPMVVFESPGELWVRRELVEGSTRTEPSIVIMALTEAEQKRQEAYHVVWFRELGRTLSPAVQSGLLDLTGKNVTFPDPTADRNIDTSGVTFLFDSNYLSPDTHVLTPFDDALRRRPTMTIVLDYLPAEQEEAVLEYVSNYQKRPLDREVIRQVVMLGQLIRRDRSQGQLQSVAPPTIHNFLAFLRQHQAMPQRSLTDVALKTLAAASPEDRGQMMSLCAHAFGVAEVYQEETAGVAF